MPFPFVAVTLPDDTPPAYVASLLSACSQAYPEGSCRTDPDSSLPTATNAESGSDVATKAASEAAAAKSSSSNSANPDSVILANITWTNPTTATLLLGLPHWRNHRWIERSVPFKEQDQPLERYRALGFTIGSLAVTVSEVAKLEQEAREPDPKAEPAVERVKPPEPTGKTVPAPKPPASPGEDPPDAVDIPIITGDHEATSLFVRGYLAGELGEGFDTVRRGGGAGLGLFGNRWGARVSGYYSDASAGGLAATFAGVELTADLRVEWTVLEANICVGAGYGHLSARVDKEASQVFPSGVVSVNLTPTRWPIAPYLGLGARIFRGFETDVPELDPLGPVTPFLQVGLILSSQSNDDAKPR